MKLEDLEKSLYQKTPKEEKIFKPSPVYNKTETDKNSLKTDWNDKKFEEGKTNRIFGFLMEFNQLSRWLFWILIAALLVIIAISGFYFYQYSTSRDVNLSLKAPTNVLLGTPFNIEIEFQNNSNKPLQDVKLSMILPDNTTVISSGQENLNFLSRNLGDLKEGVSLKEIIPVIIFGNEQSLKQFQITVSYFPPTL